MSATTGDRPADASTPLGLVRRWAGGVHWYLRQMSGESKWDDHLARCRRDGVEPMTRRDFERHRSDHAERNPQQRCC